jgi:ElaA protein
MTYQWQTTAFDGLDTRQLYALLRLRQEVFTVEQASIYLDLDNLDQGAIHILCWQDGELLAYQRCLAPGTSFRESALGRIVVAPRARGRLLGKELVVRGIRHNLERWPGQGIRLNAQAYLQDFYSALGFSADGDIYADDGIPHIQMVYTGSA